MTKATTKQSWDEDRTATLVSIVGETTPVTVSTLEAAAESLSVSTRSVASKLRKMKYEVESTAKATGKTYSADEEAELEAFLNANPTAFTYTEIAEKVLGGSRSAKQIQGKILSMELFGLVKPTPKVERAKTYTEAEEVKLEALVLAGGFIEDIAEAMGREVKSIRGKVLSMSRTNENIVIPTQKNYVSKKADAFNELGDKVADMAVAEIATSIDKTERGVKSILSHRGVTCKDYDGAKRREKLDAALAEEAANAVA